MDAVIGFDATSAVRQVAGIGRYARELLRALATRDDPFRYRLFTCSGADDAGSLPPLDSRFSRRVLPLSDRMTNAIWHRMRVPLPAQTVIGNFDLFHSPDFTLPPIAGRPGILTIHDLAFLRVPNAAYPTLRAYLERVVPRSVRRARHIIAVSESTKRDLIQLLNVAPDRISVVLEGVGPPFEAAPGPCDDRDIAELGIDVPFLLTSGTLEPRKNYVRLLEAFAAARRHGVTLPLVIAGRPGWLYEPILQRRRDLELDEAVLLVTPSDRQLAALYRRTEAFIYPSLYEGFGIPPLEAMACGAPVGCSNTSSLPEVVGDAALLFDPLDVDAMREVIETLVSGGDVRGRLRSAGLDRAASLTWQQTAAGTVDIYRSVLRAA